MKQIQLGHHQNRKYKNPIMWALVDDEDFDDLSKHKWYSRKHGKTYYATRIITVCRSPRIRINIHMHREIMHAPTKLCVDHIDRNGLNNKRNNLRICTTKENQKNKGIQKNNTSGFKGVMWDKGCLKWRAQIQNDKKKIHLGLFDTVVEAYQEYCKASVIHHGKFSNLG